MANSNCDFAITSHYDKWHIYVCNGAALDKQESVKSLDWWPWRYVYIWFPCNISKQVLCGSHFWLEHDLGLSDPGPTYHNNPYPKNQHSRTQLLMPCSSPVWSQAPYVKRLVLLSTIPYYTDYTVLEILKRHTTNSLPHWNSSWPLWMHETSEHDCIQSTLSIFPFRYFFNLKAFQTQCIRKALHHCQTFIVCGRFVRHSRNHTLTRSGSTPRSQRLATASPVQTKTLNKSDQFL